MHRDADPLSRAQPVLRLQAGRQPPGACEDLGVGEALSGIEDQDCGAMRRFGAAQDIRDIGIGAGIDNANGAPGAVSLCPIRANAAAGFCDAACRTVSG
jgi:hypothetical protein